MGPDYEPKEIFLFNLLFYNAKRKQSQHVRFGTYRQLLAKPYAKYRLARFFGANIKKMYMNTRRHLNKMIH